MRNACILLLYIVCVVVTGGVMCTIGAPQIADRSGIAVVDVRQLARMSATAPDHCSSPPDPDAWVDDIDPSCSQAARALAYVDHMHIGGAYLVRLAVFGLFLAGFTLSCARNAVSPMTDTLGAVIRSGALWMPIAVLAPLLIDRLGAVRAVAWAWGANGF